ncbi:MAG: SufD family Fe-S cluster assembly protein [Alloprevotella sp.]
MDNYLIPAGTSSAKFLQFSPGTDEIHLVLEENAELAATALLNIPPGTSHCLRLTVEQLAGSRLNIVAFTMRGGNFRADLHIRLLGKGAEARIAGAVIADGDETVEKNILVEHAAEGCSSDMLYKQILTGESSGLIEGKVLVQPGAQQTTSQQTFGNLLLSDTARVQSRPMLEIYADDVKCNHGATIGKLDDAALFYMRQRGIPEVEARLLLQHAFVNDILQRVGNEELREKLSHLIEHRFRGELKACHGCSLCQ